MERSFRQTCMACGDRFRVAAYDECQCPGCGWTPEGDEAYRRYLSGEDEDPRGHRLALTVVHGSWL